MIVMTKQIKKNSNIFKAKRGFSACRPTDAVNNHKGVDHLYIKPLNVLYIEKKRQPSLEYL